VTTTVFFHGGHGAVRRWRRRVRCMSWAQ